MQRVFPGFALVLDGIKVAARGWTRESEDNSRPLTKRFGDRKKRRMAEGTFRLIGMGKRGV